MVPWYNWQTTINKKLFLRKILMRCFIKHKKEEKLLKELKWACHLLRDLRRSFFFKKRSGLATSVFKLFPSYVKKKSVFDPVSCTLVECPHGCHSNPYL